MGLVQFFFTLRQSIVSEVEPVYDPSLDFSDERNSQYVALF